MSLCFVADTFQMSLTVQNGVAGGKRFVVFDFGAFSLGWRILAVSDYKGPSNYGFWIHVLGDLYLYMTLGKALRTLLYLVDGSKVGFKGLPDAARFGSGIEKETLKRLRSFDAIKTVYRYDQDAESYRKLFPAEIPRLFHE